MPIEAEFARKLFTGPCEFVAGATSLDALPESDLPEAAFVGRSNVGKSSLINALTNRVSLARVSHTPGRTRQVNLFRLRDCLMLADLPGYGFARVSKAETASWNVLITEYLHLRRSLRRVVLLIDSRRGLLDSDKQVLSLLDQAAVPTQFVLTKSDEPRTADLQHTREEICREAERHPATLAQVIVTSVTSRAGIPELREALAELAVH